MMRLLLIGGGAHADVVLDVVHAHNRAEAERSAVAPAVDDISPSSSTEVRLAHRIHVIGYVDDHPPASSSPEVVASSPSLREQLRVPYLGTLASLTAAAAATAAAASTATTNETDAHEQPLRYILALGDVSVRQRVARLLSDATLQPLPPLIHPSAIISVDVRMGHGTIVCAGANIGVNTRIGEHCIIAPGAIVSHHCEVDAHAHLCPGMRMCGRSSIGVGAFIGAGSTVLPRVRVHDQARIGAGSTVLRDVPTDLAVRGVIDKTAIRIAQEAHTRRQTSPTTASQSSASAPTPAPAVSPLLAPKAAPLVATPRSPSAVTVLVPSSVSGLNSSPSIGLRWIPPKSPNYVQIQSLLAASVASNHFANGGPAVRQLERYLTHLLQIPPNKVLILTSSGTTALHAAVATTTYRRPLSHGRTRARFATQALTFLAVLTGPLADSLIVDMHPTSGSLDLSLVRPEEVDGLILTCLFGHAPDLDAYVTWTQQHGKLLLLDCAAAPLTFYHGVNLLAFGQATILSLHHTKPLGFGEGGALIVDASREEVARRSINFGIVTTPPPAHGVSDGTRGVDEMMTTPVVADGVGQTVNSSIVHHLPMVLCNNGKMSDVSAAHIHSHILDTTDDAMRIQRQTVDAFRTMLHRTGLWSAGVRFWVDHADGDCPTGRIDARMRLLSCICLTLPCQVTRERLSILSVESHIDVRKLYPPLGSGSNHAERVRLQWPIAHRLHAQSVCIPCHSHMSPTLLDGCERILRTLLNEGKPPLAKL